MGTSNVIERYPVAMRVAAHLLSGMLVGVPLMALAQDVPPAAQSAPAKASKAKAGKAKQPAAEDAQGAALPAKDPAVALASYTAGVKAYQAGKFEATIQSMNAAVQNGGLTSVMLAKALYYRGAAYQQQGKPGQAISDLTSALWLKGGLDSLERSEATRLRSAAYAAAGLSDQGQVADAAGASSRAISSGDIVTGSVGGAPGSRLTAPAETPAAASTGGIGAIFGNLFDGLSPAKPAPAPAPVQVAAAEVPAAVPAPVSSGEPEVLPWAKDPSAAVPAAGAASSGPAPAQPKAAAKAATKKAAGAFRIQVATFKSRDEASAAINKLQGLGGVIAATPSSVDETTFGANTFYRVRLGPFASAAEAKQPCATLKANGLDCLILSK